MKKIILLLLVITTLITGCKTVSDVTNTKLDNKKERLLKGTWVLTAVDYPGADFLKIKSFSIEDSKCFVGSNWTFISNNNKGEMALTSTNSSCKDFSSPITWYINKEGKFVLKIINDYKAKEQTQGFILEIKNISETGFLLVDTINVANQITNITYTFTKQ